MSLSLTIADNADGSGCVATLSGADGGAAGAVYAALFNGQMGVEPFVIVGTITGSGNVAISSSTLPLGYYVWVATSTVSSSPAISNSVYQNVTNQTVNGKSTHGQILDAFAVGINSIGFSWLPSAKVEERWIPKFRDIVEGSTPICYVSPVGSEEYRDGTTGQDDPGYPVFLVLIIKCQASLIIDDRVLMWRQRVSKYFRHQRLAGVPDVYFTEIHPDTIVDPPGFDKNYILSVLTFRCYIREGRGL